MKTPSLFLTLLVLCATAQAESLATALGRGFGSLGCTDLQDPDSKTTCQAHALSNGSGCMGLSSKAMREKCMDELPVASDKRPKARSKKTVLVNPNPQPPSAMVQAPPVLSDREIKQFEDSFGLKTAPR